MYLKNNNLITIKKDFSGNLVVNGRFKNLYGESGNKHFLDIFKWKLSKNPKHHLKKNEKYALKVLENTSLLHEKDDYICWLGHASFLIQIDGKKILTDPCFYNLPFIKRLTKLPVKIEDLNPDYILISHGHYDHLDTKTLKLFKNTQALIPLNMSDIIVKTNPNIITQEASWYQQYNIDEKFKITFLPAHHWHKRTINDTNKILWGSFIIENNDKRIYFAGDSGYSQHFSDIGKLYENIDIAILPIGAYEPRWFMQSSHIDPTEAVIASKDLKAKIIIPMHFGTYDLSDEPINEPKEVFKKVSLNQNVKILDIGEKFTL